MLKTLLALRIETFINHMQCTDVTCTGNSFLLKKSLVHGFTCSHISFVTGEKQKKTSVHLITFLNLILSDFAGFR